MHQFAKSARRVAALALAALALSVTACKVEPEDLHPEVDFMRITIAGQDPVLVNSTGTVTGGPLSIQSGVATTVMVAFLDANLQDALGGFTNEFQAIVEPEAGITFARTGAFQGTLTGAGAGTVAVAFSMFHIDDGEEEFGPFNVNIAVTAPPVVIGQ